MYITKKTIKWRATEWERISIRSTSDSGLKSILCKDLKNSQENKWPNFKNCYEFEQGVFKRKNKMTKKYSDILFVF